MLRMNVNTALAEVPVNLIPLIDDTDFKSIETGIAYNATGMSLTWNFVTVNGSYTSTSVTPTTAGDYDWAHQGQGMYTVEIPASGGGSINNDAEGYGWFTGVADGVLPWRGPTIQFSPAALNASLVTGPALASQTSVDVVDGIVDAILVDTGTTLQAELDGIQADTEDIQTRLPASLVGGRMDANVSGSGLTTGAIADAVWEEAVADHSGTSGSTAEALSAAGGSGDPWVTALPGSYTAGQAGYILGTYVDAAVSTRSTYSGADTAGTTTLLSRLSASRAGYLDNLSAGSVALASSILDAADIRAALGMSAADLDSQLSATPSAVWSSGTRTLTSGANITLAKGSGVTGFTDVDAADIRTAVGLASANIDAQFSAIPTASQVASAVSSTATSSPLAANIKQVNDVTVVGDGQNGTEWGPA